MKKFFAFLAAAFVGLSAFAQTADEILDKMGEVMEAQESSGLVMTMDMKIPILGTISSKTATLGDKTYLTASSMGEYVYTWTDYASLTSWTYDTKKNVVTIESLDPVKAAEDSGDAELFSNASDGYDASIKKETDKVWVIECKKQKNNTNKDDPKNMQIIVAKGSYIPVSLQAKVKGITVTLRDISFGVKESDVTFDMSKVPSGVPVEDKR